MRCVTSSREGREGDWFIGGSFEFNVFVFEERLDFFLGEANVAHFDKKRSGVFFSECEPGEAEPVFVGGDEFAVGAFGRDEVFFFEEGERFLDGVGIDFGGEGEFADGGEPVSRGVGARNNQKFQPFS